MSIILFNIDSNTFLTRGNKYLKSIVDKAELPNNQSGSNHYLNFGVNQITYGIITATIGTLFKLISFTLDIVFAAYNINNQTKFKNHLKSATLTIPIIFLDLVGSVILIASGIFRLSILG